MLLQLGAEPLTKVVAETNTEFLIDLVVPLQYPGQLFVDCGKQRDQLRYGPALPRFGVGICASNGLHTLHVIPTCPAIQRFTRRIALWQRKESLCGYIEIATQPLNRVVQKICGCVLGRSGDITNSFVLAP
jgi:hypothetical protein